VGAEIASPSDGDRKLGTFGGVFTPSLLTILGLVLFLRLGFVTGQVGPIQMVLILGLATSVSLLTTVSLAAIATNLKVGGGGVYYLISRTLGPAFGGSIGLVLYLAMSVSVAFYAIGLGEAVARVVGSEADRAPQLIAAGTVAVLLGVAWLGADVATRVQYLVMACLGVALVAFAVGVADDLSFARFEDNLSTPTTGIGFWASFAIFFPAITGFTQGVAMSGDLRTPSRSITVGTFGAIGLSTLIYLLVIVAFTMAVPLAVLRDDTGIMRELALHPLLVDLGVIAATLSSAIASLLGGPRTLQRLAGDRLIRPLEPFAVGVGPDHNPRRGVLLSAAIALLTVALGDLDVIAPVISMFFLASYGMINYATYSEVRAASTSFRPTFRFFDWRVSLLGTVACVGVILAIDPLAGAAAGAAVYGLYRYLRRSMQQVRWADSTRGFHATEVRTHLQSMSERQDSGRDWRPVTVAFVPRDPDRRSRLLDVATWIEGGAGFTTAVRIVPGRGPVVRKQTQELGLELARELGGRRTRVYGRAVMAPDLEIGVATTLQTHGIGPVRPNLALFSWDHLQYEPSADDEQRRAMLQTGPRFGCTTAIVHAGDAAWSRMQASPAEQRQIGIWWDDERCGQLLTMLAWMCTRSRGPWARATLSVWVDESVSSAAGEIAELLEEARMPARVAGVAAADRLTVTLQSADLVFVPLTLRNGVAHGPGGVALGDVVPHLPLAVFAHNATDIDLDAQPDDGVLAQMAEARDRAESAEARAGALDLEASTLLVAAEVLRAGGSEPLEIASAEAAAVSAQRRYLDARARADEAWRLVGHLDPTTSHGDIDEALWLTPSGDGGGGRAANGRPPG
jgi:amino acid transporter